jgi:hypothetical protein
MNTTGDYRPGIFSQSVNFNVFLKGKMQRRAVDPLERFTDAKKEMGKVYHDLRSFIGDLHGIYAGKQTLI